MAQFTPQIVILAGVTPAKNQATAADWFYNSGRIFILMENLDVAERSVIINSQKDCDQGSDHDETIIVLPANDWKMIGPLPKDRFNDALGKVHLTYTGVVDEIKITLLEVT
ncbi:hypothetical protein KA005_18650 [bacterium]|nr:hypothetical protein [bacterium]